MGAWAYNEGVGRQPIDRGLGVQHHNRSAEGRGINAKLITQAPESAEIGLWVYDVAADFKVAGQRAQSPKTREFYPRNFVQPVLSVKAQVPTNYEFNRLAEFIRHTHKRAVFFDQHNLDTPAITFILQRRGRSTARGTKGGHQGLRIEGFIPSAPRGAKRFEFAHEVEFEFVVTRSKYGLMRDEATVARKLLSWAEVVTKGADGLATRRDNPFEIDPTADNPSLAAPPDEAHIASGLVFPP